VVGSHEERRGHRDREGDIEHCEQDHQDCTGDSQDYTHEGCDERYLYAQADDVREEQDHESDNRVDGECSQ